MKKVVKVLIIVCIILAFTGIDASAESAEPKVDEATKEHVISKAEDGYMLSFLGTDSLYGDLSECLSAVSEPSVIRFEDVSFSQPITLPPGEYTICGKLYASGLCGNGVKNGK